MKPPCQVILLLGKATNQYLRLDSVLDRCRIRPTSLQLCCKLRWTTNMIKRQLGVVRKPHPVHLVRVLKQGDLLTTPSQKEQRPEPI